MQFYELLENYQLPLSSSPERTSKYRKLYAVIWKPILIIPRVYQTIRVLKFIPKPNTFGGK